MTALRYCVLDDAGLVMNMILVNDPYPENYWPGYGRYIVCAFGEPSPVLPVNLVIRTGEKPFSCLEVRPASRCEIGDTMNLITGEVAPAPQPDPTPEPALEGGASE